MRKCPYSESEREDINIERTKKKVMLQVQKVSSIAIFFKEKNKLINICLCHKYYWIDNTYKRPVTEKRLRTYDQIVYMCVYMYVYSLLFF